MKKEDFHWKHIENADLNLDFGGDDKDKAETNYVQLPNGVVLSRTVYGYSGYPKAKLISVSTSMVFIPNLKLEEKFEKTTSDKTQEDN